MKITQGKVAELNKGLKKICDSCDEQAIRLHDILDSLDEITAIVQILLGGLKEIPKQGG